MTFQYLVIVIIISNPESALLYHVTLDELITICHIVNTIVFNDEQHVQTSLSVLNTNNPILPLVQELLKVNELIL